METGRTKNSFRLALSVAGLLFVAVAGGGCAGMGPSVEFDLGFLATRDTTLQGHSRLRALGPIFESRTAPDGTGFTAVRPFYSRLSEPARQRVQHDFLWPVGTYRTMGKDVFWRFLLAYGNDFDVADPNSRYRTAIFPLIFWGRSAEGKGYFAVFPLGGRLREYLGRDELDFALFPLYVRSQIKTAETYSLLFPLISWTDGGRITRRRFLPFYGRVEESGRWKKTTIMWPIWTSAHYSYPGCQGHAYMLFPLFGRVNTDMEKTWMFLPPFFRYGGSDKRTQVYSPWPFVRYLHGDIDKFHIWPLWGTRRVGHNSDWFAAWPIAGGGRFQRGNTETSHWRVLPFLQHEKLTSSSRPAQAPAEVSKGTGLGADAGNADAGGDFTDAVSAVIGGNGDGGDGGTGTVSGVDGRYFKLWPLFSYRRENELSRVRGVDLWPVKDMDAVERNWSPLWAIYTHTRNGRVTEDELLWGFFRYRRDEERIQSLSLFPLFRVSGAPTGGWSVLLGLVGYEKEGLRKTLRLLYIPIRWGEDLANEKGKTGS